MSEYLMVILGFLVGVQCVYVIKGIGGFYRDRMLVKQLKAVYNSQTNLISGNNKEGGN